jgi:hyperosmotically inducible periplasmic protein
MKTNTWKRFNKLLSLATAGVVALGLAACDQKPKTDDAQTFEKLVQNAGRDRDAVTRDSTQPDAAPKAESAPGTDTVLEARVKAALSAEPGLRALTVDVKSSDGVVTLYGTADSPSNSHQAAMVAMNVDGVRSVKNEMVVVRGS